MKPQALRRVRLPNVRGYEQALSYRGECSSRAPAGQVRTPSRTTISAPSRAPTQPAAFRPASNALAQSRYSGRERTMRNQFAPQWMAQNQGSAPSRQPSMPRPSERTRCGLLHYGSSRPGRGSLTHHRPKPAPGPATSRRLYPTRQRL